VGDFAPFADPAAAVADLVAPFAKGGAGPKTYATLQAGPLPYIRVRRTGGSDDEVTDTAVVDVSVFDSDAANAMTVAEQCRQRLTCGPFAGSDFRTAHGRIDRVLTEVAPQLVTPPDLMVLQCVPASYRVTMRR